MSASNNGSTDKHVRMNMSVSLPISQKIGINNFFSSHPKFNKGQFVLEAILEKIEHEKEVKKVHDQIRRSNGNTN